MASIQLYDNIIKYQVKFYGLHKDQSWNLAINSIVVIGQVNKMDGDDDSDFIVFIDKKSNKYIINFTNEITGWNETVLQLKNIFNITFENNTIDKAIVIYPLSLKNNSLYQMTIKDTIKNTLALTHVANGELSDSVKKHISKAIN